jgi:hypothetical protein
MLPCGCTSEAPCPAAAWLFRRQKVRGYELHLRYAVERQEADLRRDERRRAADAARLARIVTRF